MWLLFTNLGVALQALREGTWPGVLPAYLQEGRGQAGCFFFFFFFYPFNGFLTGLCPRCLSVHQGKKKQG